MKSCYSFDNLDYFIFATLIDEKFYLVVLICIFLITSEHVFMLLNIKFFLLILLVYTLYASFCYLFFSYSFIVIYISIYSLQFSVLQICSLSLSLII